jgi:hypothetical protein
VANHVCGASLIPIIFKSCLKQQLIPIDPQLTQVVNPLQKKRNAMDQFQTLSPPKKDHTSNGQSIVIKIGIW